MTATEPLAGSARIAWFDEPGSQTARDAAAPGMALPPPAGVRAERGRGQVSVAWQPVDGAAGYLVERAPGRNGPWTPVSSGVGDVLAVPHGPFLDTTGDPTAAAWYRVASIASVESTGARASEPVEAAEGAADGRIEIAVDAGRIVGPVHRPWRPMIGSEHLALLLRGHGPGGRHVGDELAEAFRIVRRELGVERVRAHAILHDSLGVYRETEGRPVHDFSRVDEVFHRLLETGLRPVVELSFMPRDLAAGPAATTFDYEGIISPPRDWARWADLVRSFVRHCRDRFGNDEVRRWAWEVWNEPNLQLFWAGSEAGYLRLYEVTAQAVKSVDPGYPVGGPATAAAAWIDDLLAFAARSGAPIDFLSTHTYGVPPLDLRPAAARAGRPGLPVWLTEWGVSAREVGPRNDDAWPAPLVARGMRSAAGRVDSLSYWVASDHFVELGEPARFLHGGFGLLTVGNLRKPRFWALAMLERLGRDEVATETRGDGAGSLVEAWASRDADGRIAIAAWNGTLDASKAGGDAGLARDVTLRIEGLPRGRAVLRHRRVDGEHSNVLARWEAMGGGDWPDAAGWRALREGDVLEELEPEQPVEVDASGRIERSFVLPMPAVSLIEVVPAA